MLAGQGSLNDNNWHTVRFSRRASNLRLQVDGAAPVRGMLCMYQQHIFFALISVHDRSLKKEYIGRNEVNDEITVEIDNKNREIF